MEDEKKLFLEYKKTKSIDIRNRIIENYAPLVKYISSRMASTMPPNVEADDLMSYGVMGLIDAIEKFDLSRDVKFTTYASTRVRGAILDSLRANDWIPRTVRDKAKIIQKAFSEVENQLGRSATDKDVAEYMNISLEEYNQMLMDIKGINMMSLDDIINEESEDKDVSPSDILEGSPHLQPDYKIKHEDVKNIIKQAIEKLPDAEKKVVYLYYFEELTLKEIGEVIGVTESRVSQLHTHIMLKLKGLLADSKEIIMDTINE